MKAVRIVLGFSLLLQAACVGSAHTTLTPLAAFQDAIAMADPEKPENPPVLSNGPWAEELVPYAYLDGMGTSATRLAEAAWTKGMEFMPDVLLYFDFGAQQVGSVSTYYGWGVSGSENIYRITCRVLLCRAAPCVLPFVADPKTGMVQVLGPAAKGSGLLEGDTVLSVGIGDGGSDIPWNDLVFTRAERLRLKVGQQVHVVAVRPGTGRIEAMVTTQENPATYRNGQRLIDTSKRRVYTVTKQGRRVWSTSSAADYDE